MKAYLTFSPIIILIIFFYIVYRWFKNLKEFQKVSGINPFSIKESFKAFFNPPKNEPGLSSYKKLKETGKKYFKVWIITLLIFIVGAFIVGILTAKPG